MIETILDLVKSDFYGKKAYHWWRENEETDCFELLERHKLTAVTYMKGNTTIPNKQKEVLAEQYQQLVKHQEKISRDCAELQKMAQQAGVRIINIKGAALNADLYGNGLGHVSRDIDFLVSKEDIGKLHAALMRSGYRQWGGMTSAGIMSTGKSTETYKRAFLALHAEQGFEETPYALKRYPQKPEYLPYVKKGCPNVEVHDGLYFWEESAVKDLLANGCTEDGTGFWKLRPEYEFLLLVTNAYENSESFYSNSYDFGIVLRDYVDLRFFFLKYQGSLNWKSVMEKLDSFDIRNIAEIILGNLQEVYGQDVTKGILPGLKSAGSKWGISILERMQDMEMARKNALAIIRKDWSHEGQKRIFKVTSALKNTNIQKLGKCILPEDVLYNVEYTCDALILSWAIPDKYQSGDGKQLYQFGLFPLSDDFTYTSYKAALVIQEGKFIAAGHRTDRYILGAVKKMSGKILDIEREKYTEGIIVKMKLPYDELLISIGQDISMCFAAEVFEQHYGNIYHKLDKLHDTPVMSLMEIEGKPGYV